MLAGSRYNRTDRWGKIVTFRQAPGIKDLKAVERSSLAGKLQVLKICSCGKVVTCWQAPGIKDLKAVERS